MKHLLKTGDEIVQLKVRDIHGPLVRECQELPREHRTALGRALDLQEVVSELGIVRKFVLDERCVVQHHGEKIVEVMRDAAGEKADALEAFGLSQAGLEISLASFCRDVFGDVSSERRDALDRSVGVAERAVSKGDVETGTVLADPFCLERLDRFAGTEAGQEVRAFGRAIGRDNDEVLANGLVRRIPVDALRSGVPVRNEPVHRRSDDRVRR